jgi:acetyl esterase/lipase
MHHRTIAPSHHRTIGEPQASAGVPVEYREYRNQCHVFLYFGGAVEQAVPALDEVAASIARLFSYDGAREGGRHAVASL